MDVRDGGGEFGRSRDGLPAARAGRSRPVPLVLDHTRGNLKAVQKLLGHSSISTTGDVYTDWDVDHLAETLRGMYEGQEL